MPLILCMVTYVVHTQIPPYPISPKSISPELQKILDSADSFEGSIGKQFKPFVAMDIFGVAVTKEMLLGKITLINFWFEACPSCHLQFENLNNIYDRYRLDTNFRVISITFDNATEAKSNAAKHGLKYNVISVPKNLCTFLNFGKGYPSNFIIDRTGAVAFGHLGSGQTGTDPYAEIIIPKIDSLLAVQ